MGWFCVSVFVLVSVCVVSGVVVISVYMVSGSYWCECCDVLECNVMKYFLLMDVCCVCFVVYVVVVWVMVMCRYVLFFRMDVDILIVVC